MVKALKVCTTAISRNNFISEYIKGVSLVTHLFLSPLLAFSYHDLKANSPSIRLRHSIIECKKNTVH